MAESSREHLRLARVIPIPPRHLVERLMRKCGQFLTQAIDCLILARNSVYLPCNFMVRQANESMFSTSMKLWSRLWQQALQLGRANCPRCSPFGRLMIQSCSISGSQAEGLTSRGRGSVFGNTSDEVMMYVLGPVQWVLTDTEIRGAAGTTGSARTPRLILAPADRPGFVRVLQQRQSDCPHPEMLPFLAEDVRLFNSELAFATQLHTKLLVNRSAPSYVDLIDGACPTMSAEVLELVRQRHQELGLPEVENVPCLHVPCWPSQEFFTRGREHGWPPAAALEDMERFGVHLVPVGATDSYEWRWSFSRAEMVTVMHLDPVPRCALTTVKACEEVVTLSGKSLKSCYVKTAVLWLCQAKRGQSWESVSEGVLEILDYLEKAFTAKQLCCFYWQDINMLELTKRKERRATLWTIIYIRRHMTSLMLQRMWPYLPPLLREPLLREPQPRLSDGQMRVALIRSLVTHGVKLSSSMYFRSFALRTFSAMISFVALSSTPAEVRVMFREYATPWHLRSCLFHALLVAPREVVSRTHLTENEDGSFVWDVTPLMELLTEECVCLFLSPVPGPASGEVTRRRRQMLGRDRPAARDQPGQFCTRLLAIQT